MKRLAILLFVIISAFITGVRSPSRIVAQTSPSVSSSIFGFNMRGLQNESPENIKNILNYLTQCKTKAVNTIRMWADGDPKKVAQVLASAPPGIEFILTLTDFYGISDVIDPTLYFKSSQNPESKEYQRIQSVIQNVASNPQALSRVAGWEVMNEPNCSSSDSCVSAQHSYLRTFSDLIYKYDQGHFISAGTQGQNTGGENFDSGDYEKILKLPRISAGTCHLYPEDPTSVANCQKALSLSKAQGKKFYIGEAGILGPGGNSCSGPDGRNACTNEQLQQRATKIFQIQETFTRAGADGLLLWQFNPPASRVSRPDGYSIYPGDPLCGAAGDLVYTPIPVPDDKYFAPAPRQRSAPLSRPPSEEYTEACPREEPGIGPEKNIAPNYRTFDGKIQPEMRNDAGLNYRSGGVLGAFCGTSKGTPILLREEAPYRLKDVPQCKVGGWAGELQFNYDDPGTIGAPVPFAQEIANQLEGDWSAPFVQEEEMDRKEKLATEAKTSDLINIARVKAISEIERRNGILKMILSREQQDQMKCDLVEYVGIKGGQSVYANFRIEGRLMSSIPCPPNVTNPTGYTDKERADWDKVWATKWKRIPLVPNEYSVGDWRHIVCDDRLYSGIGAYPEVMRLGLSANALWKQLTPVVEQQRFFAAGYQAMRDPLHSKELLGFALRRRRGPQQLPLPPVPYLVNKTMDQMAKDTDQDPQCRVKETPRPTFDNGRCIHFVPSGQYDEDTLNRNVERMKAMGMTRTLALYDDENVLKRAAVAFGKAGIMPVWRKTLRADQAPVDYPWDRDIAIMKQYGNNDVKQYGPMIQLYNEPGDSREWADGVVKFSTYLTNFAAMSKRIMAAGGRVGIQLQDPAELVALISKIKSDSSINQKDYWNKIFFVPHLYNERHAPNWTADEIGVLGFRPFAEVFQKELGFVPPMIVGEGGPEVKDHPNDNPKVTREMHAAWVSEVYNWFANGKVSDGRPLPDYLLGFCNWVIDAVGKTEFQNFAWYNNLSGGDLTQTINAVKNLPNVERKFSCEKPQSLVPFIRTHLASQGESLRSAIRALVPWVPKVFAQEGTETDCGGLSLDMQVEVVNPDPNNFVYALRMSRNACSPKGILGDLQINPPKNYELANPGKTGPHIVSITGEGLYLLNTYEGASGFMPPVRSVEELNQYTWTVSADRFPEGHRFHDVALSYTGIINPNGPGLFAGGRCDTTKQCCETITCEYALPRPSQLGPSDTGGNFGDRYSAGHKIVGADWDGKTGKYSYNPVKLIWKVPAWHAGERPIPEGCSIVVDNPKTAPTCSGPEGDGGCGASGYEACNEQEGKCGNVYCMKVHDRVVDSYQSVPFLDSAWKQLAGSALNDRFFGVYTMFKSPVFKGTAAKPPETGCTMNIAQVFDRKGDFVTNPGAGEVTYGFDQGFGVGAERADSAYNNFGIKEVKVYQVLPEQGKKAKVLFYRLGGLCNATLWLSQAMMSPIAISNPGLLAQVLRSGTAQTGAVGPPGGGSFGVGSFGSITQQPGQKKTASVVTAGAEVAQKVTAQVNTLIGGAPTEVPTVYTVVNTSLLSLLDGFSAVAVGDHILVYEKSRRIFLLRPAANTIISQPQPLLVGLRNGSGVAAALDKFLAELRLWLPHVIVVERADAVKKDYTKTLLVPVDGSKRQLAQAISTILDLTLADLPPGESASAAQLLFIVGSLGLTAQ